MTIIEENRNEAWALAGMLSGRYGRLALTRAASEADAAEKAGNKELSALWSTVVNHLRQSMVSAQANEAV